MEIIIILVALFHYSSAVIYRLNASDYHRMPPVNFLDDYVTCIEVPDNVYCTFYADLESDTPSELLTMIQEFSLHTPTHFNHSYIFRGICVNNSCSAFYNDTSDLKQILEACLSKSLWKNYQLKGKIREEIFCNTFHDYRNVDALDMSVGCIIIIILMVNFVGSIYDFYLEKNGRTGNKYLLFFSVRKNLKRLTKSFADGPEPRLSRLRAFTGVRMASMLLVICAHASIPSMVVVDNTRFVENMYDWNTMHVFLNGNLIVRSYFIMSVFMLIYNLLLQRETHELKWTYIPMGIFYRITRLLPTYALVLACNMTWVRFLGHGPLWDVTVLMETKHCRRDWWKHLLFINNYYDQSHCNIPTWYLAADMQMYCVAIIVFIVCRTNFARKIAIGVLLFAGVTIPAVTIYLLDIEPLPVSSPTALQGLFTNDKSFNNIYKRGHAHVISVAFGMALAMIVYHCQQIDFDPNKYKNYRYLVWLTVAAGYTLLMMCFPFYADAPRLSLALRIVYSIVVVPTMHLILSFTFWSLVVKLEGVYRGILEWSGWTIPSRATYCAFLVHASIIRIISGSWTELINSSIQQILEFTTFIIILSYAISIPLYLLVESPFNQLLKLRRGSQKTPLQEKKLSNVTVMKEVPVKEDFLTKNDEDMSKL